jgi:predicted HTH transcriptional regulator
MNESTFKDLLNKCESDTLDFKAIQYDFSGVDKPAQDYKRASFVKDILCMKNTPRDESAYIVLGVKNNRDCSKELIGLTWHHDDADLQSKLQSWVFPHPKFRYSVVKHEGKDFGVITIPADREIGPCLPVKEFPGGLLNARQLYFRRNSQNAEADYEEQK